MKYSFLYLIQKHIDLSISNTTPLGRWKKVGTSCDEILNFYLNRKIRTFIRKRQYLSINNKQ